METTVTPTDIERVIGRVVVGYRVVGGIWLGILGLITLAGSSPPDRPAVVIATMAGVGGWAFLTGWFHRRDSVVLRTWWWLVADVCVTIWVLFSSDMAGTASTFYGGYPMSTVFMGVFSFAIAGGLATAAALSTATILRLIESAGSDPTNDSAAVLIYIFGGLLAGWAVGVIRRSDRLRWEAEDALAAERASRARAEERSEMAAHLHDSVLQTLALIQRAGDFDETVSLARRQEHELRSWLFGSGASPAESFAAAVRAMAAEVEELFQVRIETVVVGDTTLSPGIDALVKAGREAAINAARHSSVNEFSVFAEVTDGSASLFVRDRGLGFDAGEVPADRKGITESIVGRLARHGGSATIRSSEGAGTEVILELEFGA